MDLSTLLNLLPEREALVMAVIIALSSITAKFVPPPRAGSLWCIPYKMLTILACNTGWATNYFQHNRTPPSSKSAPH